MNLLSPDEPLGSPGNPRPLSVGSNTKPTKPEKTSFRQSLRFRSTGPQKRKASLSGSDELGGLSVVTENDSSKSSMTNPSSIARRSSVDFVPPTSILTETLLGRASIKKMNSSSSLVVDDEDEDGSRYEISTRKKSKRIEKLENTLETEVDRRRTIHEIDLKTDLVDELINNCLPYDIKEAEFNLSDDIQYYSQDPMSDPFGSSSSSSSSTGGNGKSENPFGGGSEEKENEKNENNEDNGKKNNGGGEEKQELEDVIASIDENDKENVIKKFPNPFERTDAQMRIESMDVSHKPTILERERSGDGIIVDNGIQLGHKRRIDFTLVGSDHTIGFYERVEESIQEELKCLTNTPPSSPSVEESKDEKFDFGEDGNKNDKKVISPHSGNYWKTKLEGMNCLSYQIMHDISLPNLKLLWILNDPFLSQLFFQFLKSEYAHESLLFLKL